MDMQPVSSSQVESIGYDPHTKTMHVKFKRGGSLYEYRDCPLETYNRLASASSIGSQLKGIVAGLPYSKLA